MSKLKFEGGKLVQPLSAGVDKDKDGIKSVEIVGEIRIDALEALNEISGKDFGFLLDFVTKKKQELGL